MNGTQFLKGLAIILVGAILLLNNLNILEWSVWYNIFKLWPLLLVSLGISLIFRRRLSWLAPLVILLGIIIGIGAGYMGIDLSLEGTISTEVITLQREIELVPVTKKVEQKAEEDVSETKEVIAETDTEILDEEDKEITTDEAETEETAEEEIEETEMLPNVQKANLHLSYDVGVFNLEFPTPLIYQCQVSYRYPYFKPIEEYSVSEQVANIHIYHDSLSSSDNHFRNPKNQVDLKLNKNIIYDILIETGATTINYDLSNFKVKQFSVKSGASDIQIIAPQYSGDININSGVSKIDISIPKNVGAIISLDTGLSTKDFGKEFKKEEGNKYISENYNNSEYKVNINIDSGLSQISIHYI
jgi:hypothetical protein